MQDFDQYTEVEIKCKNHELCNVVLSNSYESICTRCSIMFGKPLKTQNNIECPLCFECKKGVFYPKCKHSICIDCFKRCFYGDKCMEIEPVFPYPDIEDEYDEDPENIKWTCLEYVLIGVYNTEWNNWDDTRNEKYEKEKYLRMCALCRK